MSYAARAACSIRLNSLLSKAVAASYGSAVHMDPTSSFTLGVRNLSSSPCMWASHSCLQRFSHHSIRCHARYGLDLLLRLSDAGARKMMTGKITCGVKKGVRVPGCKHSIGVSFRFGVFANKRLPAMEGHSFLLLYPLNANASSITFP